jgi:hypothetical protein
MEKMHAKPFTKMYYFALQCEISTVLNRFNIKELNSLVAKTNVSVFYDRKNNTMFVGANKYQGVRRFYACNKRQPPFKRGTRSKSGCVHTY